MGSNQSSKSGAASGCAGWWDVVGLLMAWSPLGPARQRRVHSASAPGDYADLNSNHSRYRTRKGAALVGRSQATAVFSLIPGERGCIKEAPASVENSDRADGRPATLIDL